MKTTIMFCAIVLVLSVFTGSALGGQEGSSNTFYGQGAGNAIATDGYRNTFIGRSAGSSTTSGDGNTFLGNEAGRFNDTGNNNTFLGNCAGHSNTSGYSNLFLGNKAGSSNTTGGRNTFLGNFAGSSNTTGDLNIFLGYHTGYANTTGYHNTFLGNFAGSSNTIGYLNVFIGYRAGYNETGSSKLYIDNSSTSTPLIYGEFDNDILAINGKVGIGTQTPSHPLEMAGGAYTDGNSWIDVSSREYKEEIEQLSREEALEAIQGLNPVKYAYKTDRGEQRVGFIAEEVPELVSLKDRKGLSSMDIVAVLTKVVQEQQKTISVLSEKVAELERALKAQGD